MGWEGKLTRGMGIGDGRMFPVGEIGEKNSLSSACMCNFAFPVTGHSVHRLEKVCFFFAAVFAIGIERCCFMSHDVLTLSYEDIT